MFVVVIVSNMETLEALKESLARSDTMTHNMLGILNSFENRLGRLEETIIPIYKETGNLQRRHESLYTVVLFLLSQYMQLKRLIASMCLYPLATESFGAHVQYGIYPFCRRTPGH